jgi:hypothetical protein
MPGLALALALLADLAVVGLKPESAMPAEIAADLAGRAEVVADATDACPFGLGLGDPLAFDDPAPGRRQRLLLPGLLSAGGIGPYRSVALLSEDAGRTWREVMETTPGSEVSEVVLRGAEAWALVAFGVEGPGPVDLWHSADAGRTWAKRAHFEKRNPLGIVRGLVFTDAQHGRVIVDYEGMDLVPPANLQVTEDGGRTWRVAGPAPKAEPAAAATTPGLWRVRRGVKDTQDVQRRSPGSNRWRTAATLPLRYARAADGSFTPCREKPAKR